MVEAKSTSPGSPLSPEALYYSSWTSPIAPIHAAATPLGLCRIVLGDIEERDFVRLLEDRYGIKPVRSAVPFRDFKQELGRYLSGKGLSFSSPIGFLFGAPFDRKVWEVLARIPYGQTRSYHWVAHEIGRPHASRAVGGACGRNPLPIIIPCHRVLAKSGRLGGYTGGVHFKKWLLRLEQTHAQTRLSGFG